MKKKLKNHEKKTITQAVKLNAEEMRVLLSKAHKYTEGNISLLIRKAVSAYGKK